LYVKDDRRGGGGLKLVPPLLPFFKTYFSIFSCRGGEGRLCLTGLKSGFVNYDNLKNQK